MNPSRDGWPTKRTTGASGDRTFLLGEVSITHKGAVDIGEPVPFQMGKLDIRCITRDNHVDTVRSHVFVVLLVLSL